MYEHQIIKDLRRDPKKSISFVIEEIMKAHHFGVVNPARIWKHYGITGRKGDSTADRPHRKSKLYSKQPTVLADVPISP